LAFPAHAQQDPLTAEQARQKLDSRRQELESTEGRARAIASDIEQLAEERRRLNERLIETGAMIQSSEARLGAIEARLSELEAQEKLLEGSLDQRHGHMAKLMSALLRIGRNPPPVVITRREDALQMVRSAMLLGAAFPELRSQAAALVGRLEELARVMGDIRSEGDRLKAETTRLNDARVRLSSLLEEKRQTATERQTELKQVRQAASEIAKSLTDLNEVIARLDQAVTRNTGLGAYEEEMRKGAQAPAAASPPSGTVPAPVAPLAAPAESAAAAPAQETEVALAAPPKPPVTVELTPSNAPLSNPGRLKPAIPFQQARARLPMPAHGRRVLAFGDKTQFGGLSKGQVFETRPGAQIVAPCDGWVVYAGEFRSYGQLLIINAGGGYHMLLAGLSQIDAQPGEFVLAAQPVGTMGGVSGARGAQRTGAPVLYVELRKDGRPIDPEPWWAAEQLKAQDVGHQRVQG
jgi:septal ring factor EnvC (AmiA/AmiB activator)